MVEFDYTMLVYLVESETDHYPELYGIFSSREVAEAVAKKNAPCVVTEFTLDQETRK